MTAGITFRGFFGDAEHPFALTDKMVAELEQITGVGIGALYLRTVAGQFHVADLPEVLRLALIGGGMAPERAKRLVDTYGRDRPLSETYPLALDVLDARWNGVPELQPQDPPA